MTEERSISPRKGRDPYGAYRFVGNAVALTVLACCVIELIANVLHPIPRDFVAPWAAARLALAGHPAAAYDGAALRAVQTAAADFGTTNAQMPFPYPPAYLALGAPFGLLPFGLSMTLWAVATFGFFMWASGRLLPRAGWLPAAFPAVYATAADGQNGFLTVGLLMSGFALCRRRPFAAGVVLGCLIIKPQLALMLPVAFIASRNWRVIAGAAISATMALVGGALLFGFSATQAWLDQAPLIVMVTRNGLVSWSMLSSVYAAARGWGVPPEAAMAIHAVPAVGAAIVVWRTWSSKEADEQLKIAVLCAASALASPYLFFYDGVILIPAFLILATRVQRPILLLALWSLPLLQIGLIAFGISTINLNAGLAIALTAMLFAHWTATAGARETPGSSPILRVEQPSHVTLS